MVLTTLFDIPRLSGAIPGLLVRGSAVNHPRFGRGVVFDAEDGFVIFDKVAQVLHSPQALVGGLADVALDFGQPGSLECRQALGRCQDFLFQRNYDASWMQPPARGGRCPEHRGLSAWTVAGVAAATSILRVTAGFPALAGFGSPLEAPDQIRLGPGGVVCWLPATAVTP
jgi:hypothetical protein